MIHPLRKARQTRGQTLAEVARAVGTDAGNLSRIETGKQQATPKLAAALAQHFAGDVSEIQILYPDRAA